MNPWLGWILAAVLAAASWQAYGWAGLAMAASAIVFWLLLQFNRALRVMKAAADRPIGQVPSAVMFHAGLQRGMTMLQIVSRTKTLGRKIPGVRDAWIWADEGGRAATLEFVKGRLVDWTLDKPEEDAPHTAR